MRYSLVVSISTPKTEVDFYTPIITQVEVGVKNTVELKLLKTYKRRENKKGKTSSGYSVKWDTFEISDNWRWIRLVTILNVLTVTRNYDKRAIASSLSIIRLINPCIIETIDYFIYVFALLLGIELIRIVDNDTAQPNLSATNVKTTCFPSRHLLNNSAF